MTRGVFLLARLGAAVFFVATSIYALLVYLPFSYQQFILSNVDPRLATFVAWHHVMFWGVIAAVALTSIGDIRHRRTRLRNAIFFISMAAAGIWLLAQPLLPGLRSDPSSLAICLVALGPILWMAALDISSAGGTLVWGPEDSGEDRHIFNTALCTAVFVSLTYFAIAGTRSTDLSREALVIALAWTLAAHLLFFGAVFLVLLGVRGVVALFGASAFHETILVVCAAALLAAFVLQHIVLAAISFTGPIAAAVALALALSLAGLVTGLLVRLRPVSVLPIRSALHILTWPLAFLGAPPLRWARRVLAVTAIAGAAWLLAVSTQMADWNALLQKLSAVAIWIVTFAAFYAMSRGRGRAVSGTAIVWLLLAAVLPAAAYRALTTVEDRARGVLDGHAGADPSFKVIYESLSAASRTGDRDFYDYLQRNTNIPREVKVDPVDVRLAGTLTPAAGAAPHIFIIVIDSLRQDYVSPYNPRVTFTPAIDAFAREGVVFKRAFTRYGATGLSEPSIWTGGMLVHKQYVLPFAPMNALDKLLAANRYQRFVSRDTILRTIMPKGPGDVELDEKVPNMDYELCRSLTDLRARVRGRDAAAPPIFAYTMPQNIHISVMTRQGASVQAGEAYPGFYAPYAARIRAMDACFGEFVQFLRDERLYDNSVIVLTSDHGDSLGEGGRWGHAYTIFPEILRIPLIVHLPPAMQADVTCESDALASLVDITPTLYYALGHRPLAGGPVFGRSLCTATPQERIASRRDAHMVVSSYGPVYGILRGNGRWLYIADGVNYTDYYYDLNSDPFGAQNRITPAVRREHQQLIRDGIDEINRFYFPNR
jgi:hypothetical protein